MVSKFRNFVGKSTRLLGFVRACVPLQLGPKSEETLNLAQWKWYWPIGAAPAAHASNSITRQEIVSNLVCRMEKSPRWQRAPRKAGGHAARPETRVVSSAAAGKAALCRRDPSCLAAAHMDSAFVPATQERAQHGSRDDLQSDLHCAI